MKRWFSRGDIDGFFGLFVDNLLQLMLIATLCPAVCGFTPDFVTTTLLPAAAVSILAGNLFYVWQARRLARSENRTDVTALPYGINTVSLIGYIFLVMGPVYRDTGSADLAWKTGLFACLLSGVMEVGGAFVGGWLRAHTPRAALLSALAGVALTFISMGFVFQIFSTPLLALAPLFLILACYASRLRLPLGLPGGFAAVAAGTALAWIVHGLGVAGFAPAGGLPATPGLHLPVPVVGEVFTFLAGPDGWKHLAVIIPMGLFNVVGSLQCLESAAAAGDRYPTRSSLLMNGAGTLIAAFLGSAFPTTIYIGHPGWKAMGARHAYSTLNGIVITALCLAGAVTTVLQYIPLEVMLGILVWIGLIMIAQAFQECPKAHAPAIGMGLLPALAGWALFLVDTTARTAGSSLADLAPRFGNSLHLHGLIALNQGFILSSMILAALMVHAIERTFFRAALWALAAAALSATGLIHAYRLDASGVQNHFGWWAAGDFALAYTAVALLMALLGLWQRRQVRNRREGEALSEP